MLRPATDLHAVALAALLTLSPPQDPTPPAINLVFSPEAPPPGSTVTVSYQPLETLAEEPELILRGHFRIPRRIDGGHALRNERIATLTPGGGGSFTGSFQLPDSAAYGAFVVEDIAGERLDTNAGTHFELLIHGEDKTSLSDALIERALEHEVRDPVIFRESMERAMELRREVLAEQYPGDSVTVTFHDSPIAIGGEDRALIEVSPEMRWTRTWVRWQQDRDSRAALDELEDHWPAVEGRRTGIANTGLLIAVETRDLAAVDRWAERILGEGWADPWLDKLMVARLIREIPVRRARALELARGALAEFDAVDLAGYSGRPLGQTVREYAGVLARARADALIEYYRLLADAGFEDEVIDALAAATAESAESELFRRLGELRLGRSDITGAARAFAVVASDPGTPSVQAGALARRVGYSAESPEWRRLQDSASASVLPRARADAVRRSLPPMRVADREGERLALDQVLGGKPAVVVFWARWCGPCVAEIPEVARLATLVEPHGVRVVSISTDDPPGPEMDAWLHQRRVTYPVYYDLDGEAGAAFGVGTIPAGFVLDGDGLVRFEFSNIGEIPRQLEVLGLLGRGSG